MRLRADPFNRISSGKKTIEYRLHDEKRSLLNKGDYIRFIETTIEETGQKVLVEIVDIITADSFVVLCQEKVQIKYALLMLSYPAKASALSSNAA